MSVYIIFFGQIVYEINSRLLHDNELGRIKSDGLFGRLPNLIKLDLRRNQITGIDQNSFEGASRIFELYDNCIIIIKVIPLF